MEIQVIKGQEQIVRDVRRVGNGAHVFAPKDWIGEEVVIVRTQKSNVRERILEVLSPHLEDVVGVYLFGSYARGEAEKDSDIDLFVITNKKIKIKHKGFEIISLKEEDVEKSIEIAPVMIYSALAEAKPILNAGLLERFRENYVVKKRDFIEYLEEVERVIKINEELLDPYSIILRLRGIYLIKSLLGGERYTHKRFKSWILKNVSGVDYKTVYGDYRNVKMGVRGYKSKDEDLQKILGFLKREMLKLEKRINGKKKKKT